MAKPSKIALFLKVFDALILYTETKIGDYFSVFSLFDRVLFYFI